jgi:hypothetical protein
VTLHAFGHGKFSDIETLTDAAGHYTVSFPGQDLSVHSVSVDVPLDRDGPLMRPTYDTFRAHLDKPKPGETLKLDAPLARQWGFSAKLRDNQGRPVKPKQARVWANGIGFISEVDRDDRPGGICLCGTGSSSDFEERSPRFSDPSHAQLDFQEGRLDCAGWSPEVHPKDKVRLTIEVWGYLPLKLNDLHLLPSQDDVVQLDLTLQSGRSIEGRVVDTQGQPAAGADVEAQAFDPVGEPFSGPQTQTDDKGRFKLEGVPPEAPIHLWVRHHGHFAQAPTVLSPAQTGSITLRLDGDGEIAGRVLDDQGQPKGRVRLSAYLEDDAMPFAFVSDYVTADAEGRFRFSGWPSSGRVRVSLSEPGLTDVKITVPIGTQDAELRLPPAQPPDP